MKTEAAEEEEKPATGSPMIPIGPAPPTDPSSSISTSSSSSSALSSSSSSSSSLSSDELDSSGTAATHLPLSAAFPTSPTTSRSLADSRDHLSRNSEAMSSMAFAILDTSDRIPAISALAFFDSASWSTNGAMHSPTISTSIHGHSPTTSISPSISRAESCFGVFGVLVFFFFLLIREHPNLEYRHRLHPTKPSSLFSHALSLSAHLSHDTSFKSPYKHND